jgi:hypothetical protein
VNAPKRFLIYDNLVERGIFNNRMTLRRAIKDHGFPKPYKLSSTRVLWDEVEVDAWLVSRRVVGRGQAVNGNSKLKKSRPVRTRSVGGSNVSTAHQRLIALAGGFLDDASSELDGDGIDALVAGLKALQLILAEIKRAARPSIPKAQSVERECRQ